MEVKVSWERICMILEVIDDYEKMLYCVCGDGFMEDFLLFFFNEELKINKVLVEL